MPTNYRRRTYLVKRGLQFRYIGVVFALALLASLVTGYTVFATGWTLLGEKLANVYPQGRLIVVLRTINITLVRNLLLASPLIFLLGLFSSHKIAGPVYRIEKTLYEIAEGNLGLKIKLRKGDELMDLAEILNSMTGNIRDIVISNKNAASKIQKELANIKKAMSGQPLDPAVLQSSINNLEADINALNSSLDKWSTS